MSSGASLKITQVGSRISETPGARAVLKGLGLGRIGHSVTVANTPSFRGMVKKVMHLVRIEEVK